MSLTKIKLHNFRSIESLDLSIPDNNRVVCFVGENGSAKTSVLGLLFEALLFSSSYDFKDVKKDSKHRIRMISVNEIKQGKKFYSVEFSYRNTEKNIQTYKRLVGSEGLNPDLYEDVIQGINLNTDYFSEHLSVQNKPEDEFLKDHVFLDRPSTRFELDGMDVLDNENQNQTQMIYEQLLQQYRPHNVKVKHSGKHLQNVLIDLVFDMYIGYNDSKEVVKELATILSSITGKNYGRILINQSPYRQVVFSEAGDIPKMSQGELDLLVTISSIIEQQLILKPHHKNVNILQIPGIVLIDEVDLHLHPKAQEKYLRVLCDTFPNIQFVITTHSPFVIRGLPDESIVVNLPTGSIFNERFNSMDIDSITNAIFDYTGTFSDQTLSKIEHFKTLAINAHDNIDELKILYNELSQSYSARNELKVLITAFINDVELIETIVG